MNDEQLAAIRARCEAATPGPWNAQLRKTDWMVMHKGNAFLLPGRICLVDDNVPRSELDAYFIAHARTDVLILLEELAKAHARIASLERFLSRLKA